MTEKEWNACPDVGAMLGFLHNGKRFERKTWLLIAAMGRSCWFVSTDGAFRKVVDIAERYADGLAKSDELVEEIFQIGFRYATSLQTLGWDAAAWALHGSDLPWMLEIARRMSEAAQEGTGQNGSPSRFLRDIFGPLPFRTPHFDVRRRTGLVLSLAEAVYEERIAPDRERPGWLVLDPVRLMVLADALEELGAEESEILTHLRERRDHVRGCWAVDLVLVKE